MNSFILIRETKNYNQKKIKLFTFIKNEFPKCRKEINERLKKITIRNK